MVIGIGVVGLDAFGGCFGRDDGKVDEGEDGFYGEGVRVEIWGGGCGGLGGEGLIDGVTTFWAG